MSLSAEVVIIGAGIVGTACARSLSKAGMDVLILDGRSVGSGATAAGMGHLVIMDDSEAQLALTRYSQQLWNDLFPQLPDDCEVDHCGTLWVASDDEEMEEAQRKHEVYQSLDLHSELVEESSLREVEPNLRPGLRGGLRIPGDSVIYPPCAAHWLLADAIRHGCQTQFGNVVRELTEHQLRLADDSIVNAKVIVNATGSWAPRLTPGLPIRAKKGHLVITDRYPGFVHHQILELGYLKSAHGSESDSVAFNVQPRKTGQLLIGSSRQYDREDRKVDHEILQRMLNQAVSFLPELRNVSAIRVWTGLRAATPDSLPLIGAHPKIEDLYLATGHEGLGITTSLGTAEILTSLLTRSPCAIDPLSYSPNRFLDPPG